jgi:hypothetical protein
MMPRIIICQRGTDYHACFEGQPEYWDCGATEAEAVGNLMLNWGTSLYGKTHRNPAYADSGVAMATYKIGGMVRKERA